MVIGTHTTIHQGHLEEALQSLFPGKSLRKHTKKEANIVNPSSNYHLEVDIWIPSLQLCLEFQDSYHFITTHYAHQPLAYVQNRDNQKQTSIRQSGAHLVTIPCWWNGSRESLAATIHFFVPSLQSASTEAIPVNPPPNFFQERYIPGVGELMMASYMGEAEVKRTGTWWIGEKYDGIRFCWNPYQHTVYSRHALEIAVAPSISVKLPSETIDGEIWFGRDQFFESQKVIVSPDSVSWHLLRTILFDTPSIERHNTPFEGRYSFLLCAVNSEHPHSIIAPRTEGFDLTQIRVILRNIINSGGEGIILRKKGSYYEPGRNISLVKLKSYRADSEGLVVGIELKLIILRLPSGVLLKVNVDENQQIQHKIEKGDVVSIAYQSVSSKGVPIDPLFIRVREDISWKDVLRNYTNEEKVQNGHINNSSNWVTRSKLQTSNERRKNNMRKRRKAFLRFAQFERFDPFIPDNWYRYNGVNFCEFQGGTGLLRRYNYSFKKALLHLFPNIGLDSRRFIAISRANKVDNFQSRKEVFSNYAKSKGFDPLVPENWYSVNVAEFKATKGASFLQHYNNSLRRALLQLFPNIPWDPHKFRASHNHWRDPQNRRDLFLHFAREKGIDPFIPTHWYQFNVDDFLTIKGAPACLEYHNGSFKDALLYLFPDVGLELNKFKPPSRLISKSSLTQNAKFT